MSGFIQINRAENRDLLGGSAASRGQWRRGTSGAKTSIGVQYFRSWASRRRARGWAYRRAGPRRAPGPRAGDPKDGRVDQPRRVRRRGGLLRRSGLHHRRTPVRRQQRLRNGILGRLLSRRSVRRGSCRTSRISRELNAMNSVRFRATYGASGVQPGALNALRYYQTGQREHPRHRAVRRDVRRARQRRPQAPVLG